MPRPRILKDTQGGPLLEFTVLLVFFFVFVFGMIEFMLLFWQFNGASKAVQHGARIAAVSDPVAPNFREYDGTEFTDLQPGDPIPVGAYWAECDGATGQCESNQGLMAGPLDSDALNTIVYGRGNGSQCATGEGLHRVGMCFFFPQIEPENIVIRYDATGLGFVNRPGGPVPTVTISLQDLDFRFFFLGGLIDLNRIAIPMLRTTVTGEDLSVTWGTT